MQFILVNKATTHYTTTLWRYDMKATKTTVRIRLESLSIDTVAGMLADIAEQISNGAEHGSITFDDGDNMDWEITRIPVTF